MTVLPTSGIVRMELATQYGALVLGENGRAGSAVPLEGAVSFFHADTYGSVATWGFSVIDNVVVTDVPEPASISLLALAALGVLRRR